MQAFVFQGAKLGEERSDHEGHEQRRKRTFVNNLKTRQLEAGFTFYY
ncbi:hypothetical protein [Pseudobacillus wudalianchiensis]|nr:hypothetical protein [Bacillus wudalianchiensis]